MDEGEKRKLKCDAEGRYRRFIGLTFIALLENAHQLAPLLDEISGSDLVKVYSALPLATMHMTLKNHETAAFSGLRDNEMYLEEKLKQISLLNKMQEACRRHAVCPVATMEEIQVGATIRIRLKMSTASEAQGIGLIDELVQLGSRPEPGFVFHVTLAYRYGYTEPDAAKLIQLFEHDFAGRELVFGETSLHYFPSMEEFIKL